MIKDRHLNDWSLMGELATEMDVIDSAKASSGLDFGLEKQCCLGWNEDHCSGLAGCKILLKRLYVHACLEAFVPICSWLSYVISILVGKYNTCYSIKQAIGFMTLAIGNVKRTQSSRPRTNPWGSPVHVVVGWGWRFNFFETGWEIGQIWRVNIWEYTYSQMN